MRTPVSGGSPQSVLTASQFSEWGLRFECPHGNGMSCVLAQRQAKQIVFRPFDPAKGFEPDLEEIGRYDYDPKTWSDWAIAPDGSHLAWTEWEPSEARIHIIALQSSGEKSSLEREIPIRGWSHLHAVSWAPDGKGWFAVAQLPAGWTLLYVDPQGKPRVLLNVAGATFAPDVFPAPDGRHLAFSEQGFGSNVWLLENF